VRPILVLLVKRVIQKNVFVRFINGSYLRIENKIMKRVKHLVSNFINITTVSGLCSK
jgi:hypothetical protein